MLSYWYIMKKDGSLHVRQEDPNDCIVGVDRGREVADGSRFGGRRTGRFGRGMVITVCRWARRNRCGGWYNLRLCLCLLRGRINDRLVEIVLPWCVYGFGGLSCEMCRRIWASKTSPTPSPSTSAESEVLTWHRALVVHEKCTTIGNECWI